MNLGFGRFEVVPILPTVHGSPTESPSLTWTGMVDSTVESLDFTSMTDRSRILYNRTEPGDTNLTFGVGSTLTTANLRHGRRHRRHQRGRLPIYNSSPAGICSSSLA